MIMMTNKMGFKLDNLKLERDVSVVRQSVLSNYNFSKDIALIKLS